MMLRAIVLGAEFVWHFRLGSEFAGYLQRVSEVRRSHLGFLRFLGNKVGCRVLVFRHNFPVFCRDNSILVLFSLFGCGRFWACCLWGFCWFWRRRLFYQYLTVDMFFNFSQWLLFKGLRTWDFLGESAHVLCCFKLRMLMVCETIRVDIAFSGL